MLVPDHPHSKKSKEVSLCSGAILWVLIYARCLLAETVGNTEKSLAPSSSFPPFRLDSSKLLQAEQSELSQPLLT